MKLVDHLAILAAVLMVAAGLVYLVMQHVGRRLTGAREGTQVPSALDRRRHHRKPVAHVTVSLPSLSGADGLTVENVSPGGICLSVGASSVPMDAVVQTTLVAPGRGKPISAEARTVWVEGGRVGLAFTRTDTDLRRWLEEA